MKKFLTILFLIGVIFAWDAISFAQTPPTLPSQLPQVNVSTTQDVTNILNRLLQWAFSILGIIAVMVILYAGALFMFSGDNQKLREQAKGYLLFGAIGVAIAIMAGSIVVIVNNILQGR